MGKCGMIHDESVMGTLQTTRPVENAPHPQALLAPTPAFSHLALLVSLTTLHLGSHPIARLRALYSHLTDLLSNLTILPS